MGTPTVPIPGTSFGVAWVDICNRALSRIGTARISALDDGSVNAGYCADLLGEAIGNVVGVYDWRCLKTRVQLAQSSGTPLNDYSYAYTLPQDYERKVHVESMSSDPTTVSSADASPRPTYYKYSIEGRQLLTDGTVVYLTYIRTPGNDDPPTLPNTFKAAIAAELAVLLLTPIRVAKFLAPLLIGERDKKLAAAIDADDASGEEVSGPTERGYEYFDELRG